MTQVSATAIDGIEPPGALPHPDRPRRWYQAALAALLVGIYLAWWLTYAQVHLPPIRYDQLPPGAVASKLGADFTLRSLTQSEELVATYGEPRPAPAGAVWVIASLDVTQHSVQPNFNCALMLVADDGRSWETPSGLFLSRPTERCLPPDAVLGLTYPIEAIFQVPVSDVDRIAGVGVPQYNAGRDPLLTPPR